MLTPAMSKDLSQPLPLDASTPTDDKSSSEEGRISSDRALFGLNTEALSALMVNAGEPGWRGRQLTEAIYHHRVTNLSEITTLTKSLRQRLADKGWEVRRPQIVQAFQSADGTERYLIQGQGENSLAGESSIADGVVETVWMPEGDDGDGSDQDNPKRRPSIRRDHSPMAIGSAPPSASPAR
jgi:hypothetical protein